MVFFTIGAVHLVCVHRARMAVSIGRALLLRVTGLCKDKANTDAIP